MPRERSPLPTKTVAVRHEDGRHGNDDRLHGEKLRTSCEIDGKIRGIIGASSGFTRKYSILRELRIITLSLFPCLNDNTRQISGQNANFIMLIIIKQASKPNKM
ncbi:hypothetical protein [uncultured Parabacteroides sp.]|uniref:hypothetical protein n=1 Tax=uncultured Parabacteroides sp. TaxID=512312 RepID=UPI00262A8D7E|nr:hypothetical protein [uncultured Parabacteroides sp.]